VTRKHGAYLGVGVVLMGAGALLLLLALTSVLMGIFGAQITLIILLLSVFIIAGAAVGAGMSEDGWLN
jgi:hypothetical protein